MLENMGRMANRIYPIESRPTAGVLAQIKCLKTRIVFLEEAELAPELIHCVKTDQCFSNSHKPGYF